MEGHSDGSEVPPAVVPLTMLRQRAAIMFSGATGAVVASGEGEATSSPSFGLVRDVVSVVESLPAALFDRYAEHRPCGLLDRYGAYGMLIGDVLGLPLMTWELAEPVGKAAAKLPEKIPAEVKKVKKKLKRRGKDPALADAQVLSRRVKLPLPTAEEIAVPSMALAPAPAAPPAPPSAPPPVPAPSLTHEGQGAQAGCRSSTGCGARARRKDASRPGAALWLEEGGRGDFVRDRARACRVESHELARRPRVPTAVDAGAG